MGEYLGYIIMAAICLSVTAIMLGISYWRYRFNLMTKILMYILPLTAFLAIFSYHNGVVSQGVQEYAWSRTLITLPIIIGSSVLVLYLVYRHAVQPFGPMAEIMSEIALYRDLTKKIEISPREDEVFIIQSSFRELSDQLSGLVGGLQASTGRLSHSIAEISATARQSVATVEEQGSVISEMTVTMDEINQTAKSVAANAQEMEEAAAGAQEAGRLSVNVVSEAVEFIHGISSRLSTVQEKIIALEEKNRQIVEIVETVNEFAEQSNLLAVNASIEAARVGEKRRGFAVVASEVRNLAEQSKRATKQIQTILGSINQSSTKAVESTGEANQRTHQGRQSLDAARGFIIQLGDVLEQNSAKARQIAAVSSQQAAGIKQISEAMESIATGGRNMETGTKELENAISGLENLGHKLQGTIEDYRIA